MSDITLAVGDGARRMTYAELAVVRGISPASAKHLAQRHHWGRQTGNDGVTRVTVPLSALVKPAQTKEKSVTPDSESMSPATAATQRVSSGDVTGDVVDDVTPATEVLDGALEALREQLTKADQREEAERSRAGRAERQLEVERQRVEDSRKRIAELQEALTDAMVAERIAAGEAAALRAQAEERRTWRRLRWALRPLLVIILMFAAMPSEAGSVPRELPSCRLYIAAQRQCTLDSCDGRRLHRLKHECLRDGGGLP